MNLIEFTSKDACTKILNNLINLNRYDRNFINDIVYKYLDKGKALTEKQAHVVDHIFTKYKKQLSGKKVDYKEILALPWTFPFFTIEEIQKNTYFHVQDNKMYLYFKFDKDVIEHVRSIIYDDAHEYQNKIQLNVITNNQKFNFIWDTDNMQWHGEFNVHLFKQLYIFALYKNINVNDSTKELYNRLFNEAGKLSDWQTKIHIVNDTIYINNIVETMLQYINKFDFKDLSLNNIENICIALGIEAPDIYNKNYRRLINISKSNRPYSVYKETDIQDLKDYLKETDKKVLFYLHNNSESNQLEDESNFVFNKEMKDWDNVDVVCKDYSFVKRSIEHDDLIKDNNYDIIVTSFTEHTLDMFITGTAIDKIVQRKIIWIQ